MGASQIPNGSGHYSRHRGEKYAKRNYNSRWAARRSMMRRWALDWIEMGTYPCTGGKQEENGKLHYHFGHSSARERWEGWKDLQQFRFRHNVLFRLFALRRTLRYLVKGGKHTGAHKGGSVIKPAKPYSNPKNQAKRARRNANVARRKEFVANGDRFTECPQHGPQLELNVPGLTGGEFVCIECI
jgi:hypothetical protein